MSRSLPTLEAELNSLHRHHAGSVTVERWLPEWSPIISNPANHYYIGHGAATNADGTILFRARVDSNGLQTALITGTDLNNPATWESLWTSNVASNYMRPAWEDDDDDNSLQGEERGGMVEVIDTGSGFRVFALQRPSGSATYFNLRAFDYNYSGAQTGSVVVTTVSGLDTFSAQFACGDANTLFVLRTRQVEDAIPGATWSAWKVYGSYIERYYYNGSSWALINNTFLFHTSMEAGLLRDDPFQSDNFSSTSWTKTNQQWGKRFCGGMAAFPITSKNVSLVVVGATHWRRQGYNTHTQSMRSFIYHTNSGLWQSQGCFEAGNADFEDDYRLDYDVFAKSNRVAGSNILVWSRFTEPSDYQQSADAQAIPRHNEVVYAKVSDDGLHLTQHQYLGPPKELNSASIVYANGKLYALGYQSVYESPPATFFLEDNPEKSSLELAVTGWTASRNNRWGMTVDLEVEKASALFEANTAFKSGSLVRANYGTEGDLVQVAQGYLDINTPTITVEGRSHKAKFNARADKVLMETKAEVIDDILPQETKFIPPGDPVKHISKHNGLWQLAKGAWDSLFFSDQYGVADTPVYRLMSFPYAYTGGAGGYGDPGRILNERPQHKGSWWKDVCWLAHTPMVDGSIQAAVRFGDTKNQGNFSHNTTTGDTVYATITRPDGLITQIQWRTGGYGGPVWNYVDQAACAAGVICHALDIGKKYAFVWEANTSGATPFSDSSHTDDTWTGEDFDNVDFGSFSRGSNRLYLIVSDFDDTDEDWLDNDKWVNRVVAGGIVATGLTPGRPAELKMQVLGGMIHCFYRPYTADSGTNSNWYYAFSYNSGRFGAGRFGIIGRGHAGIQWDALYPGRNYIIKCDNYVDFWNIHLSDCALDRPMEEILRKRVWQGFTETEFRAKVDEATRGVNNTTYFYQDAPVENLSVDFNLNVPANVEGGIFLRGVDFNNPTNQCIRLGLVNTGGTNSPGSVVQYYAVKRYYEGGAEQPAYREYSPTPFQWPINAPIPVRITSRGRIYTIWVAGNYAGHFVDDTQLGVWWGLYSIGGTATFINIYLPELYEVPEFSTVDVNQTYADAAKKIINRRRIKGVYTYDGKLKLSYFDTHEDGGTYEGQLIQSSVRRSDRFASIVRVDGAWTHAQYSSSAMLLKGRRFEQISMPDIFHREFCYREAKAILTEIAEQQEQPTLVGPPDPRTEPEDEINVTVSRQNVFGDLLVDDITIAFRRGKKPSAGMQISTRQKVVL